MKLHNRQLIPMQHLLSEQAFTRVEETLTTVHVPKDTLLIQDSKVEINAYIIQQGIARAYIDTPEKEITFWFAREGNIINSGNGYAAHEKGYENFHMLEDAVLLKIDMKAMRELYYSDLEICNWSRIITETEAMASQKKHLDYILLSPEERYLKLVKEDSELLHRVPLKDIATYLGISAVSLSRIRGRIK